MYRTSNASDSFRTDAWRDVLCIFFYYRFYSLLTHFYLIHRFLLRFGLIHGLLLFPALLSPIEDSLTGCGARCSAYLLLNARR
ncbi:hypothetical protein PAHAL_9G260500 [Panicum hallii]|uniref:Uncharacterized protein n=1 Tax=Panicum hallii TaxID=206008 RepID=A0A2T8I2L6_9POAL|nr:hypothetical protein PAHAL_9G260500 [Panicum hallii]